MTVQIAFTLILLVAAGLFIQTLHGLLAKGPGFETSSLISFGIRPALIMATRMRKQPSSFVELVRASAVRAALKPRPLRLSSYCSEERGITL